MKLASTLIKLIPPFYEARSRKIDAKRSKAMIFVSTPMKTQEG